MNLDTANHTGGGGGGGWESNRAGAAGVERSTGDPGAGKGGRGEGRGWGEMGGKFTCDPFGRLRKQHSGEVLVGEGWGPLLHNPHIEIQPPPNRIITPRHPFSPPHPPMKAISPVRLQRYYQPALGPAEKSNPTGGKPQPKYRFVP